MGTVTRPFCWHQNFVHKGLSTAAPGLYTCGKTLKMCIKSEFKEICLKLATNGRSDKGFLLTSKVCPQVVFCPCPGAMYMYQIIKNVYKIRSFWNLQHMGKEKRPFCCYQNFVPSGLSALALGYIYMVKHEKNVYKIEFQSIFLKPATNGQSDKGFLLTSTFVPKGLYVPALGLYTCIKALKYIPGPGSGELLQDHWSSGLNILSAWYKTKQFQSF